MDYLLQSIALNISASKKNPDTTQEEVRLELGKVFDMDLFEVKTETESGIKFAIKPDIVKTNLANFLEEQYDFMNLSQSMSMKSFLQEIKNSPVAKLYHAMEKNTLSHGFLALSDTEKYAPLLNSLSLSRIQVLHYVYQTEGRFFSEDSSIFLTFHRNLVQKSSKNPLAQALYLDCQEINEKEEQDDGTIFVHGDRTDYHLV